MADLPSFLAGGGRAQTGQHLFVDGGYVHLDRAWNKRDTMSSHLPSLRNAISAFQLVTSLFFLWAIGVNSTTFLLTFEKSI